MRRILNGLRYGNLKTKTYIIGILFLFLFATFSIGWMIATRLPLWGMSAAFSYLVGFILMQSVSFRKVGEMKGRQKAEKQEKQEKQETQVTQGIEQTNEKGSDSDLQEESNPEVYLQQYDEKKIKGVFVKYKVNKEHYPVMIDSCDSCQIYQCPTYVWMENSSLNLLLFEKEPRKVTISLSRVQEITYERGVAVNSAKDYIGFHKPSVINMIFSSYLPTIYEEAIAGRRSHRKNLYVIGQDLKVTNTSAATMLKLLSMNLSVRKQIRDEALQNPYFETAYALNVMLKDTVITVNEFKNKVKDILQKLADAKISNEEFMNYMDQLIRGRLITREYAQYYIENRNKKR